ncbi:MAG: hypothetical protein AB7S26_28295 [Sandaracinaceae bacterium]
MSSRLDVLKSVLFRAARAGKDRIEDVGSLKELRKVFGDLRQRRMAIPESHVGAAVSEAPLVRASTVGLRRGRAVVDVGFQDGSVAVFAVIPQEVRFAPRGAKEVLFSVEPPEAVEDSRVRDIVGHVAAALARGVWGPMLGPPRPGEAALIEREGARLRADLRTVPSVRGALEGSPLSMALDVLTIERIEIEDRAMKVTVGLPAMR